MAKLDLVAITLLSLIVRTLGAIIKVTGPVGRAEMDDQGMWEQRIQRLQALFRAHPGQQRRHPIMDPLLYTAAKEGDVDKFIKALEKYCTEKAVPLTVVLQQRSPSGNTLLHAAAESDDIVRAVIGFIPQDWNHWANHSGETPLHIAARAGKTGAVELVLSRVNPTGTDRSGNSALHEAVRNRRSEVIRRLVSEDPFLLYQKNNESKSPWCVAVETGDLDLLKLLLEVMLEAPVPVGATTSGLGMSPPHLAVMYRNMDMLTEMWNKLPDPWLLPWRDAGYGTPLHLAAYTDYLDGVKFLMEKFPLSALEKDREGHLPIHVACMMDHVKVVEELLQQWPDPAEFRSRDGENILHVSARYGCISTVKYILKSPRFAHLINARDFDLNTPLHLAALHWQPSVLLLLARDGRVDLKLVNMNNMTALDVVEEAIKEMDAPLRKKLTRIILASAGTPRSRELAICRLTGRSLGKEKELPELARLKEEATTRSVVATLVAGMTFVSSMQVPGGYNSSDSDAGIAILLHKAMYNVFVICSSIAMYSSIIALVILLWAQMNDPHAVRNALSKSRVPLLIALAAMPLAFMAGVYVSVTKLAWLAILVLVLGSVALLIILSFYLLLYVPLGCKHPLVRRFTDLIIVMGISMSGSATAGSGTAVHGITYTGAYRDAGEHRLHARSEIP